SGINCHSIFFFQAEDGIRDRNVTGVQTCALPISPLRPSEAWVDELHAALRAAPADARAARPPMLPRAAGAAGPARGSSGSRSPRSEERRVGKESRSLSWTV